MIDVELTECTRCDKPTGDPQVYVCRECTTRLTTRLDLAARLAGEAAATITRQAHITADTTPRPELEPWEKNAYALRPTASPVSLTAAADHDAAVTVLTTWARHIHQESGRPLPTVATGRCPHSTCHQRHRGLIHGPRCEWQPPQHPLAALAAWLIDQLQWLRYRPEADEAYDELDDACRLIERVVDRPAVRWAAGACWCDQPLYPTAGARVVTCTSCGTTHDATELKAELLEHAEEALGGAAWCAATLTRLGVPCTAAAVRKWAERHQLHPADGDQLCDHQTCGDRRLGWIAGPTCLTGRPLYRLGDVRRLAQDAIIRGLHRQHQAEQKARRHTVECEAA